MWVLVSDDVLTCYESLGVSLISLVHLLALFIEDDSVDNTDS